MKSNFVEKSNQLPADLQEKAIKYIDSLLTQKELQRKKKPKLDWAGGLRACLKSTVCRVRTAHQPLKAPEWDQGSE